MPTWVVRMVTGEFLGSGWRPGEGLPLFDVLADVKSGAWVGAGPIIQHQYDALAIGLRPRLS